VNDKAFAADFGRKQVPRSVADAARIPAIRANLVPTGHLICRLWPFFESSGYDRRWNAMAPILEPQLRQQARRHKSEMKRRSGTDLEIYD
jgi:hypothetical protein